MHIYRYVADKAARAYWAPRPVPYEGMLCQRVVGGLWRRNQLVEFLTADPNPEARGVQVVVPWRRLRRVA
jgi:hypothetical protein